MAGPGRIPGRYNIVLKDEYETVDHQVPVQQFVSHLREASVPEELCVVGLGAAFADDAIEDVASAMDKHADDLENQHPLPTVQFAVEGTFHRHGTSYDLRHGDVLYPLQRVFGPQLDREGEGWLVAPF